MVQYWERDSWRNPQYEYLFNQRIIEYDISDAGLSISTYYHLLPEMTLQQIQSLPKEEHSIQIGLAQRSNKQYNDSLKQAFIDIRELFIKENQLKESEILAIKKDAIFTLRRVNHNQFGNVIFKEKNKYTSFLIRNGLELYYNKDKIDVKGINDNLLQKHKTFLSMLGKYFQLMELNDVSSAINYLVTMHDNYKWRELPIETYREFNAKSKYRLDIDKRLDYEIEGNIVYYDDSEILDVERLNISYNENFINSLMLLSVKILKRRPHVIHGRKINP